jgi:hypothetical protein
VRVKTERPNREPAVVVDVEGGVMTARDVKAAREVLEELVTEREFQRLANRITDAARDADTAQTRATRDRDRATPRDVSHVESARLRADLPEPGAFRKALSSRQRKVRSAAKNKVLDAAPASQRHAVRTMLTDDDPQTWRRVNGELHVAAGDVQQLSDNDRKMVQRLDRTIQSYERINDRTHTVYVAVELPDNHGDVNFEDDLPDTLRPGARVAFDQFTVARHNLHEAPGHDSRRCVMLEITTSRGMYMGRSDSLDDTTHLLPRGMQFEVVAADNGTYADGGKGFREHPLIVQLKESS